LNLIDTIPLDRQSPRSALAAFREAKDLIVDYKRSLVLFPTGTRSGSNEVGEMQPAAFKLPQMANAPIIPVTIINSYQVFEYPRKNKHVVVKVIFGKPIYGKKHLATSTTDLATLVKNQIENNRDKYIDQELTPLKELRMSEKKLAKQKEKKLKRKKKKFRDFFKIID